MPKVKVKVKLLSEEAVAPVRAHSSDAGYDLTFVGVDKIVGDVIYFKTGVSLQPSKGHYFEVFPRSSISKLPFSMANSAGIIDQGYTGEIIVPVRVHHTDMGGDTARTTYPNGIVKVFGTRPQNMSAVGDLVLKNKPKMFQAILRKRIDCDFALEELDETDRADGGFGSTD
jgi:dUTP pyrophosphatase|tara:strand:- start:508 stop:1020 length:513 start_codon:yes stop_codon:yes gene_type:complete